MRNELIPFLPADLLLEVVEEGKPLFVRHGGESIVWVLALEIRDQLRELVVRAKVSDGVCQGLPADYGRERTSGFAVSNLQCEYLKIFYVRRRRGWRYIAASIWGLLVIGEISKGAGNAYSSL